MFLQPDSDEDGVTATVPLDVLPHVDPRLHDWLVPGMLEEKALALMRGLPKALRRELVPLTEHAETFAATADQRCGLVARCTVGAPALGRCRDRSPTPGPRRHQAGCRSHLVMRFEVVDADGAVLARGPRPRGLAAPVR